MPVINYVVFGYLCLLSLIGFISMGIDKRRAIKNQFRISEFSLIMLAICGGGIGSYLGMKAFRHKTRHIKFQILLPLSALFYLIVIVITLNH